MKKTKDKTVTLTLTRKEARLVAQLVCGENVRLEEAITKGDEWPDIDIITSAARDAKRELPMVEALRIKAVRASVDAGMVQ